MVEYIDTRKDYDKVIAWINSRNLLAVDTETTGTDPLSDQLLLIQVGNSTNQYVLDFIRLKSEGVTFDEIKTWLSDREYTKVFHNAKFDYKFLKHTLGCEIEGIVCTFVIEHILKKGLRQKGFGLADVTMRYVNRDMSKAVRQTFAEHELGADYTKDQIYYAAVDVEYLLDIYAKQQELLAEANMEGLAALECAAVAPTGDMELNGIYLSPDKWKALFEISEVSRQEKEKILYEALGDTIDKFKSVLREEAISKELSRLQLKSKKTAPAQESLDLFNDKTTTSARDIAAAKVQDAKYFVVNLNSSAQMQKILSLHLGQAVESTEEEKLRRIKHPIIDKVIDLRKATKLCTTYGEEFLKKAVHPITGRVHTNFNQTRADSGRYSSSNPVNLQNIPNKTEYRAAFQVQDKDWRMICADYSG